MVLYYAMCYFDMLYDAYHALQCFLTLYYALLYFDMLYDAYHALQCFLTLYYALRSLMTLTNTI